MKLVMGAEPPMIVPYCAICEQPVERLCMDALTSFYYLGIHGQCCGRTSSARIPIEDVLKMRATGEKFWLITKTGRSQQLRPLPPLGISYTRAR